MSRPEDHEVGYAATQVTRPGSSDGFERATDLARGAIIGRYQLSARLGAGAMGEVWAATDPQLEREIAIKLVHPRLARDPDVSARMVREARAMAKVSHRAVIAIHDAGEADGRLFLAMELVPGRTLGAVLSARTPAERADWRRWLAIMIEAGRGLAAAHAAGVLHRDFKPDNVMVEPGGRVCVGDFGLATLGDSARPRASQPAISSAAVESTEIDLTMTGALLGTPIYMSLEQLHGDGVDARSDQFSYCVATYEALYGQRPFGVKDREGDLVALAESLASGTIAEPPQPDPVPVAVRAIILRGLSVKRSDRWPDLDSLLTALSRELARPARRGRSWYAALALGVVALVVAVLMIARRSNSPELVVATASKLDALPLNATFALSAAGRFATATDRVDVHDPSSGKTWTWTTRGPSWIDELQFDGETTLRWSDGSQPGKVWRWDFVAGTEPTVANEIGHWVATVVEGDLIEQLGPSGEHEVALEHDGIVQRRWPRDGAKIEFASVAPSAHRFAYLTTDRFAGRIVVIDTATNKIWRSPQLVEPSGLGWRSDETLVYGTSDGWIAEVDVGPAGFGVSRRLYRLENGWAEKILAGATRLLFVAHTPSTRARLIERETPSVRDFEPSVAAAEVGFTADGRLVLWNERTHALESRTVTGPGERLPAQLQDVPANATFAGDSLIAAERAVGGRKLVAISMSTGKVAWEHPVGASLLVRCAADLAAPCYVARRTSDATERYDVVALDPVTGTASGTPIYHGALEDIAVPADGQRLLIADGRRDLLEVDLTGTATAHLNSTLSSVRSIAYDPRGGVLVSGTIIGASYAVGKIDHGFSMLTRADGELLSIVRPSPTTGQVLTLGRSLASDLWELHVPAVSTP